jgi:tetratricopeptide (TPR) repeat protein
MRAIGSSHLIAVCLRALSVAASLFIALALAAPGAARAQVAGRMAAPSDFYLQVFRDFYDGDYPDALKVYLHEGRGAIKTAQTNWIDSICYHTMAGECYYQMGDLSRALSHYNSALQLYTAFYDWMIRVQFPPTLQPTNQIMAIPWGQRQRPAQFAHFPDVVRTLQGSVSNNDVIQRGGVVRVAQLFPIRPFEIIRCTSLAIRRRGELLGPLAEHDSLGKEVLAALARRATQPNHWSETLIDLQLGLAYAAVGKLDQARPILERSLLVAGQFDHPLTSTGLLELGRIALLQNDYPTASRCFEEATYSACQYTDPGVLEEAFRLGLTTHLMSGRPEPYPPLVAAAAWAKANDLRQLHVSLLLGAAENLAVLGQTQPAQNLLATARSSSGNRPMLRGRVGARLNYVTALILYQAGQTANADAALANLLAYERGSSHWLFQINLADSMYMQGTLSPRSALLVYQRVLRDPDGFDWGYDPIEALAALCTPHSQSYENWFLTALERDKLVAFEVADVVRRHRFLSAQPLGGRLLGLRWLLEGPPELLDKQSTLDRQGLATRFVNYDQLSQQARQQRAALAQMPLASEDPEAQRALGDAVANLGAVCLDQERVLREMAIRRNPADLVFPPQRSLKNVQESLAEGQALLSFLTTGAGVYGFLVTATDYDVWPIGDVPSVHRKLVQLLREMGLTDGNRALTEEQLAGVEWRRYAAELFTLFTASAKSNFPDTVQELVIVPDRALWYVPWAALQIGPQDHTEALIDKYRLRFAPTTGLAVGDPRSAPQHARTLLVAGRLYPRGGEELTAAAVADIQAAVPGVIPLTKRPPAPSHVYASVIDRLLVLDDADTRAKGDGWSPLEIDQGVAGSSLADWIMLPWGAPDQVLVPGFHSAAENSLKGAALDLAGDDIFQTVCGLLASGTRTVLLSQWRTGGQSSVDLMREFVQELPHVPATNAWQRSVVLARDAEIDATKEPRLQLGQRDQALKASHPFLWAGYLLIDPGPAGKQADAPAVGVALADAGKNDNANNPDAQPAGNPPGDNPPGGANPPAAAGAPIGGFAAPDGEMTDDAGAKPGKKTKKRAAPKPKRSRTKPPKEPAAEEPE